MKFIMNLVPGGADKTYSFIKLLQFGQLFYVKLLGKGPIIRF